MKKIIIIFFTLTIIACSTYRELPAPITETDWKVKELPASPQQMDGDPEAGLHYLIYGNYIGSGIPYEFLQKKLPNEPDSVFRRDGVNANINYTANVFTTANGVKVMNGNCFTCHSGKLNNEMLVGLGNSFSDYRKSLVSASKLMNFGMKIKYKKDDPEYQAFEDFGLYFRAMAPYIKTNQPGANPAFRLAEACMMHRNPDDLTYREEPNYTMEEYPIATDVPPLWNVKKKNALYYNGVGRGDFTKLLFQASVLGIPDSTAAREAINQFKDVLAWLNTLEAPEYPGKIDQDLAAQGKMVFEEHCSKCHGTYGDDWTYPNKIVSVNLVKTDPLYANYAANSGIVDWYNNSWFSNSEPRSYFEPNLGYVAPPLDGVWATAPYLHNGSVPTVEDLLNSKQRPTYWTRSNNSNDYDQAKLGWRYVVAEEVSDDWTFDATLPGYSNQGHYFGDKLSVAERNSVIEYLKTL